MPVQSAHATPYNTFEVEFDTEPAFAARKRGGWCCCSGCCLGCCGLLLLAVLALSLIWYGFFSGGVSLVASPETTIITEPLKSDGKTVDFHQAIQKMTEPDIQANENGFRDVLLGYGREVFEFGGNIGNAEGQYRAMCERLNIDPRKPPLFSLEDFNQPIIIGEQPGLDVVRAAAAKPHYFVPMVRQSEKDLVLASQPQGVYAFHGALTSVFRQRAKLQYDSDTAGAWNDMLTTIRLFRSVTINLAWLEIMEPAGSKSEAESLLTPVADLVNTLPHWKSEQLTQAITDLESLPNWQDRQTTLTMMQYAILDMLSVADDLPELMRRFNNHQLPDDLPWFFSVFGAIGCDFNLVAQELNSRLKRYEEVLKQSAENNLDKQFEQLNLRRAEEHRRKPLTEEDLNKMLEDKFRADPSLNPLFTPGRSRLFGFLAGELVANAAGEMYRLQIIEESRCQALRLALALERYHREEQKYPDSLEELGLKPMTPNMDLQYEKREAGYRIQNKVLRLDKR